MLFPRVIKVKVKNVVMPSRSKYFMLCICSLGDI